MAEGLLDFIKTPEGQGLLSGLFGYAANARQGTPWNNLGRGGVAGLMGYGGALERQDTLAQQAEAKKLRDLQMQQAQVQLDQAKAAQEAQARKRGALPELFVGGQDATPAFNPLPDSPFVPTPARPAVAPTLDWRKGLSAGYTTAELKDLAEMQNLGKSKIKQIETVNIEGKPVKIGIDEFGQKVAQIGMEWKPLERQDFGGFIGGIDPTDPTKPVVNYGNKTMSAAEIASNRVAQGNLALSRERLNFDKAGGADAAKPTFNAELGAWLYRPDAANPTGRAVRVSGMPDKPLNESQGAATNFGLRALRAHEALAGLKDQQPGTIKRTLQAFAPTEGSEASIGTMTNWTQSKTQQKAEQLQNDFISAVLRKESGASISPVERYNAQRQYFPQPGDDKETIALKQRNRETAIEGLKIQAGPGAKNIRPSSTGVTGEWESGVKFLGFE